ncbi:MAG: PEP-CTERM sorting domain-containing protein [Gammaproteobacteria bacterium]
MNTLRCFNKKLLVAATASVVLGMGMVGNASAGAYALAYDDVRNFLITGIPGFNSVATTSNTAALHIPPGGPGLPGEEAHTDPLDALQSYTTGTMAAQPQRPPENTFAPLGMAPLGYDRSDAWIINPDVLTPPGGRAINIAEGWIPDPVAATITSTAFANNLLSGQFTLGQSTDIVIAFEADAYMNTVLLPSSLPGSFALAGLDFNITISDLVGNVIHEYVPGDLNHGISSLVAGQVSEWDPTGDGIGGAYNSYNDAFTLAAGTYNIDIRMGERESIKQVPEPGTVFLLGGGLAGLAVAARRRTAAKA